MTEAPRSGGTPGQPVETFVETARVLRCPVCDKGRFEIVRLHWGGTWGPWYCDDCGFGFIGRTDEQGESYIEPWRNRKITTVVTLRSTRPVTLKVQGVRFTGEEADSDADRAERDRYYYEEHTCPTNFLGHPVLEVLDDDGDQDPHGIFTWVKTEGDV